MAFLASASPHSSYQKADHEVDQETDDEPEWGIQVVRDAVENRLPISERILKTLKIFMHMENSCEIQEI